ncbi:MAG TPA: ABC transporter permease [Gemmatimonadaceae bacterium]|jgi:putative ABC transport system permease protein|nr:ABC transporter permease [Gemmatimonadaceae bacterium]
MSLWRHLTRGGRVLLRRHTADDDVTNELRHYVELAVADLVARGIPEDEARRTAQLEIGNMTVAREQVRSYGWENVVFTALGDLRYALRRLRRSPGFAVVAVITLALGIGASTAIFSAVNPVLFRALPYPAPDRIAVISDRSGDGLPVEVAFGNYRELAARVHSFESSAAFKAWQPTLARNLEPERLSGERVGAGFFKTLGIAPAIGRDFQVDDDRPGGPSVVILSDALWRRRFGADPTIVGQHVRLDDADHVVIGVMPASFENVVAPLAQIWAPLQYASVYGPESREWGHHLRVVARLRQGVSTADAVREIDRVAQSPVPEFTRVPWARMENGFLVTSLQADVTRAIRPAMLAVLGAVCLVLMIACVNVTNLMLARGAQRRAELAMRIALGAGRGRLMRQLLTESVLLAAIGGVLGLVVARIGVRWLVALSPAELPRLSAIRVDATAFAFAALVTTIVGVVVGAIPAVHALRGDAASGLQTAGRRVTGGHQRTRAFLVVAEVALALMLLVGAGLLMRSIQRIFAVPVGFQASGLLSMQIQLTGEQYRTDEAKARYYANVLGAVRAVPGVEVAAMTSLVPLSGDLDVYGAHLERDRDAQRDGAAMRYAVAPEYFAVMGVPLVRGRLLSESDGVNSPRVAVVSRSFAKLAFGDDNPLGQRFRLGPRTGDWFTVVGVVNDVRQSSFDVNPPAAVYVTPLQWHWVDASMSVIVRGRGDPTSLATPVRSAIWSVDRDQAIVRVATMNALVSRSIADRRFALILFEAFGLAALLLASTGIYGVLSGAVTERVREIGVRAALGAQPLDIVGMVVRQGVGLAGVGLLLGLAAATIASRAVNALLFGVSHLDATTYVSVVALLATAALVASALPAFRAARIDPAMTLRSE